jgi:hypothetical protein
VNLANLSILRENEIIVRKLANIEKKIEIIEQHEEENIEQETSKDNQIYIQRKHH